jgi:MinD superfamily P-loop ATPase
MPDKKERSTGDIIEETENQSCPVRKAAYYIDAFLKELMCGKCFPCALGTHEAALVLQDIISGNASNTDIGKLRHIADIMIISSRCKKGRDTAQFIIELLKTGTFSEHAEGRCPDRECAAYSEYSIVAEKCIMCGACQDVCKYHAVVGEKKIPYLSGYVPFVIVSRRCTRCGECLNVCPNEAIIVVDKRDAIVMADK